jgi:hypothetical protein
LTQVSNNVTDKGGSEIGSKSKSILDMIVSSDEVIEKILTSPEISQ